MNDSTNPNAQQIEYWNGPVGERWVALQDKLDRNLSGVTDGILPFAAARAGERVLDIGCGGGTTSFLLEEKVGPEGAVLGADISRPLLGLARERAKAKGSRVQFLEADASASDFGGGRFDLGFSRFGVMFFADPIAAFANIKRAMAPGGRLAFVCWRAMRDNEWTRVPFDAAKRFLPDEGPADPHAPGPFAFADPARLKTILARAGFADVAIEKYDTTMRLGGTAQTAASEAFNIGPVARAVAGLDEATRAKILAAIEAAWKPFESPNGVAPGAAVWLVGAKA